MQAPLPRAPLPRQEWEQLKTVKLAAAADSLEITWSELDGQFTEYRLKYKLAATGNTAGATYHTHVGAQFCRDSRVTI